MENPYWSCKLNTCSGAARWSTTTTRRTTWRTARRPRPNRARTPRTTARRPRRGGGCSGTGAARLTAAIPVENPYCGVTACSCHPYGEPLLRSHGLQLQSLWRTPTAESRLTAAIPMENPYCSCKLTRVRLAQGHVGLPDAGDGREAGGVGRLLAELHRADGRHHRHRHRPSALGAGRYARTHQGGSWPYS